MGYDFVKATNEIAIDNPSIGAGDQLIYVPEHKAFGEIGVTAFGVTLSYAHQGTGEVTTDREDTLPGYSKGNIRLFYNWKKSSFGLSPFFEFNNIWDTQYAVIQYRPMPGRNIRAGLKFNFNKL